MSFPVWLALSCLLTSSLAYPHFRDEIPNGNNVPHPCKPNYTWRGVGHQNPNGGGARNLFGLAFQKAGYKWTTELCKEDSDADGKTNGEELGDPSCTWQSGTLPSRTTSITHPGVCDPYTSDSCKAKNTFLNCDPDVFEACDAIKKPGVHQLNLTFLNTQIPPTETNYYCMTFDLPNDMDYHIIANEGIIDNINTLHHMLLFGCKSPDDLYIPTPEPCGMSAETKCGSIIGGWTVGQAGSCFGENIGFRIGKTGYKRVRLQIHYNNPGLVSNYTDASGIRLYYQPVPPGAQDLATLTTGQLLLEIPPGQKEVEHVGICPSSCTQALISKPAYVIRVLNHMHYRGKTMKVVVFRNGAENKTLSNDELYSYDLPVDHLHNPPFELLPGDEIKTTCMYSSSSTNHYVYYGESTSDEMCFGFITLYPKDALKFETCVSFGATSMCNIMNNDPINQCNWANFTNFTANAKVFNDVSKNCNLDGFCRPECKEVLRNLENNPCLKGEASKWVTLQLKYSRKGLDFLARLRSCPPACNNSTSGNGGNMASSIYISHLLIFICVFLMITVSGINKPGF